MGAGGCAIAILRSASREERKGEANEPYLNSLNVVIWGTI